MTRLSGSVRGGFGIAIGAAMMAMSVAGPAAAKESLPYTDSNTNGYIGFCDKDRRPVTSGSIYDQPFVWTAVSSTKAPDGYGRGKAVLAAYQPREGVEPGLWSGRQLTAPSTFTNPKHPMSQATNADDPLVFFTQSHPPRWGGLIQLRLFFSAPNMSAHRIPYPATSIRVEGDRWTIVSGGTVDCTVGKATSVASRILPKSALASPPSLKVAGSNGSPDARSTSASKSGDANLAGSKSSDGDSGGGMGSGLVAAGLVAVALLGGGGGGFYFWRRRRSIAGT